MVTFTSTPQGAEATITNGDGVPVHRDRTPFSVHPELDRGEVFELVQEWLRTVDKKFH